MKNGVKSFATIVKYEFMQHPVYIQKGPKSFITNGGQLRFKFFLIKSFFWFITKLYLFCHQRSTILVTMGQYAHFCTYRLDDHRLTDGRTNGPMEAQSLLQRCVSATKNVYISVLHFFTACNMTSQPTVVQTVCPYVFMLSKFTHRKN